MQLPSRATMLDAAARGDWCAVLGLTFFQTLTPREARSIRTQVHPDRGGDAQIAAVVGQALDEILQGGAQSAPQPQSPSDDICMNLARDICRWTREADRHAREMASHLRDAAAWASIPNRARSAIAMAELERDLERIHRRTVERLRALFRSVYPEPYLERARREEEANAEQGRREQEALHREWERQQLEEDARAERERREQEALRRERERQQHEERERAAEPVPEPTKSTPEDRSTARKRRLAEAAHERRQRARPSQTQVAGAIARLCVACSLEEASAIKSVRDALRVAGCNLTEQHALLDSSHRRQRGAGANRVYHLVYDFGRGLKPMRLR